ncbi:NAD-dependent succinate-semialdehyde dehydrogenase [Shewanella sp. D64]|uniref:NAD-dependent succinate-semialdehyde dehydrogenase n=1 Tax=unclassified Shewanella TaxID=196818 RepID=UPI0022BA550A|nr:MULTISPECIES: NAD-dependent succinate-semialdehyde dehydrogenase [unclassified Shewanella]MEC4724481.1 NAD-dependent succinate-semialdehyde dehydrogenase [Shewanella sp. D64]MEC4736742.1 NAD-dependent succinate-semialdehyde dehydrogenase [Shewanella sp. E94]WBJ94592.1 NAD-dependent succinate-semialdehyde dehydrogenase [Shewanella sp. MTB7]
MQAVKDTGLVKLSSYIDGQWSGTGARFDVTNPANGQVVAQVRNAGIAETEMAVLAAKRALPAWSKKPANERAVILRTWFNLMMAAQDDLGRILTLEQGKPLAEAKGEIAYGAAFLEWFAEEGKRVYGDTIPAPSVDKRIVVIKQPVGVVASITPWNFPNAMIARKAAAALAAGCTFVVRPSPSTPLSALAMAELAERAGVPAGVFNVVVGEDSAGMGKVLTQHPDVAKFTFTGSTAVGKILMTQTATTVKKISMELGGNAPFIVFDDADLDAAVQGALVSKYRNAGQTCVCTNRILVQKGVAQAFTDKFVAAVETLKMGDGLDVGINIGPMISSTAVDGVQALVDKTVEQGGVIIKGGKRSTDGGSFYEPTIVTNVTNDMALACNEIFGPVTPIITFDTEAEAIEMANDTEYGLAAYFYSRDIGRVWRVGEGLEYGMVGVNEGIISNPAAPFGGVKQSGNGREGSKYGLDDYLEIKYLCMGGIDR